jgi:hypothetical protein
MRLSNPTCTPLLTYSDGGIMPGEPLSTQIFVLVERLPVEVPEREPRRGKSGAATGEEAMSTEPRRWTAVPGVPNLAAVDLSGLQGQVNVFLQQLNQVMTDTPEKVGTLYLAEFEISAGIVLEAKGGVKLAFLASAEAGAGINAGLKFVFKRT